ncbi:hypothetical protein BH11MYX4_BH11MYX4_31730 [soil metagenome]
MDGENTSTEEPAGTPAEPRALPTAPARAPVAAAPGGATISVAWASSALVLTAVVGALAKVLGVVVAPGMRGVASQRTVEAVEILSATLAYTFAALLVALICGGSFELARARKIGVISRGSVVAISGLVVALASPAVVQRLHAVAGIALAVVASLLAVVASASTIRVAHTRIVGGVLGMFALSALLRPISWQLVALASERASLGLYNAGKGMATVAVVVQALAALLAAAWLWTRSRFRGRLLSNGAIVVAFAITYVAARDSGETPSSIEAVLRGSLSQAVGSVLPYGLTSIAAFLVPATILLALVAVVQRAHPPAVLATLGLALLSQGSFDVPLHALAVTAAAQWAMLAMADERTMWSALVRGRDAAA